MKVFVPFSEALVEPLMAEMGFALGELVPFQLEYECLRMNEPAPNPVGADSVREPTETPASPESSEPSRTESAPTTA
jgi:hypothetical protein